MEGKVPDMSLGKEITANRPGSSEYLTHFQPYLHCSQVSHFYTPTSHGSKANHIHPGGKE